jgi:hypothetical protein
MEDTALFILQWAISAGMILAGIVAALLVGWTVCLAWRAIVECLSRDFR